MLQAQEIIAGKFWIVMSTHGKVGTLRKTSAGYTLFDQRNNTTITYDNFEQAFTEKSKSQDTDFSGNIVTVDGYSTGVNKAYPVDHTTLPVFKKTENGKAIYAAGYYIVKFSGMGWQHAFAPKLSTLDKYNYKGPFLTEWEMNLELRKHRRNANEGSI